MTRAPTRGAALAATLALLAATALAQDPPPRLIAHALGTVEGYPIRNCRECFEASVRRGYRFMEADFLETSDGGLAVTHDGLEAAMALPRPFTLEQFRHARLLGTLHPLDAAGLAELMRSSPGVVLLPDFKSDLLRGLPILASAMEAAGVAWRSRVVPQVYAPQQLDPVLALGFERVVFTMYRLGRRPEVALEAARRSRRVLAVAMPAEWFTRELAATIHAAGTLVFLHTVNDATRAAELFAQGADALYTDTLPP